MPKPIPVEAVSPSPLSLAIFSATTPAGAPTNPPTTAGPGAFAPDAAAAINLGSPNLAARGTNASVVTKASPEPGTTCVKPFAIAFPVEPLPVPPVGALGLGAGVLGGASKSKDS